MASTTGTQSWAESTGGKLAWREQLAYIGAGVRAKAALKLSRRGATAKRIEVGDIAVPDSEIANAATALCADAATPMLFNHSLRSYYWARLIDDGTEAFDDEAFYVAAMLHDIGLTDTHRIESERQECFTLAGARLVATLAEQHRWGDRRADLAANAITLHLNVVVDDAHGREAKLLRFGSGLDVLGDGSHLLEQAQIDDVVAEIPRLDLKREILGPLKREADTCPGCRVGFAFRRLGFPRYVRSAPFHE